MPPEAQIREVKTQKGFDVLLILLAALVLYFAFHTRSRDQQSQSSDRTQVSQTTKAVAK